ncbi:MAG: cell envelope integrity protein TolA [Burkholderiaceae bacterium]
MRLSQFMHGTPDTVDFKPPPPGRWSMPMTLAVLVHGALIVALAWGVNWSRDATPVAFEAELWSSLPREAAPRAVEPPPPPPPPPAPAPQPAPTPAPPPPAPAPPPVSKEPDIATQQAKKKIEDDRRAREAAERKAEEAERKKKADEARKKKAAEERVAREKAEKLAAEKRRKEDQARRDRERREAKAAQEARDENLRRIMGQAGATGAPDARGTASRSSGPSAGYAARVAARIRPNIRYNENFAASLAAEIEVRAAPDGSIMSRRLVRSSGNSAWDDAALRAIDRTGSLPRDTDGSVPSSLSIVVKPLD